MFKTKQCTFKCFHLKGMLGLPWVVPDAWARVGESTSGSQKHTCQKSRLAIGRSVDLQIFVYSGTLIHPPPPWTPPSQLGFCSFRWVSASCKASLPFSLQGDFTFTLSNIGATSASLSTLLLQSSYTKAIRESPGTTKWCTVDRRGKTFIFYETSFSSSLSIPLLLYHTSPTSQLSLNQQHKFTLLKLNVPLNHKLWRISYHIDSFKFTELQMEIQHGLWCSWIQIACK